MHKRKTVAVREMTRRVNEMLKHSLGTRDERQGMMSVVEAMLFATGNYRGFRYLTSREITPGELPGINLDDRGEPHPDLLVRFHDTDPTRIEYHMEPV